MRLLEFSIGLKSSRPFSELSLKINDLLGTQFDDRPFEKTKNWTMWKNTIFGLEITVYYFTDKKVYFIEGERSEKIASLIPLNCKTLSTDISKEMLTLFKLVSPEDHWFIEEE